MTPKAPWRPAIGSMVMVPVIPGSLTTLVEQGKVLEIRGGSMAVVEVRSAFDKVQRIPIKVGHLRPLGTKGKRIQL